MAAVCLIAAAANPMRPPRGWGGVPSRIWRGVPQYVYRRVFGVYCVCIRVHSVAHYNTVNTREYTHKYTKLRGQGPGLVNVLWAEAQTTYLVFSWSNGSICALCVALFLG
jgi:hypothetical protein